jgi:hypothetical protein
LSAATNFHNAKSRLRAALLSLVERGEVLLALRHVAGKPQRAIESGSALRVRLPVTPRLH